MLSKIGFNIIFPSTSKSFKFSFFLPFRLKCCCTFLPHHVYYMFCLSQNVWFNHSNNILNLTCVHYRFFYVSVLICSGPVRGILPVSVRFIVDSELRKARGLFLVWFERTAPFQKRRNYKVYGIVVFSSIFLAFDNVFEENTFVFAHSVLLSFIHLRCNSLQRSLSNTLSLWSLLRLTENLDYI